MPRRGRRGKARLVKKRITRSEEQYGFIYLLKPLQSRAGLIPRYVKVIYRPDNVSTRGQLDERFRLLLGRNFMRRCNLHEGRIVKMRWVSPDEIEIMGEEVELTYDHDAVRDALYELGRMKGFIAEKEYPTPEKTKIDVIWKRTEEAAPFAAFEVQIKGNITEALTKLRRAWYLWNSRIFLVTTIDLMHKVEKQIKGPFSDIGSFIRILECGIILRLRDLTKMVKELENKYGLTF